MSFLQKDFFNSPSESFELVPHASYSHGLEKIYGRLETIDIRSVRKISSNSASSVEPQQKKQQKSEPANKTSQLEFNIEPFFRTTLDLFVLREPIQVLGFSRRIEKWLSDQGKLIIADLLENDKLTVAPLKGIGQGHFDEISNKLQTYLNAQSDNETQKIDFNSWLKTLVASLEPKKCALLLETFDLPALLPLTPAEIAEIRKLTKEKRAELIQEAIFEVSTPIKKEQIISDMRELTQIFIKPWLFKRTGISNRHELYDHLLKLSGLHPHLEGILNFMSSTYFKNTFILEPFLHTVSEELYCYDLETSVAYHEVIKTAHSYFYKPDLYYPLDALIQWIGREYARKWKGFADNFIERTIRLSTDFRVRKGPSEKLLVKLS
ncbi:MAG: hypothetical protein H0T62_00060 [Parachlamydiaceae bacterium]|nr:hypothetical protein [Parachlamydiaceae bacterium]